MSLEVLQGVHVKREGFGIVSGIIFLYRLLYVLDRLLFEITVHIFAEFLQLKAIRVRVCINRADCDCGDESCGNLGAIGS